MVPQIEKKKKQMGLKADQNNRRVSELGHRLIEIIQSEDKTDE